MASTSTVENPATSAIRPSSTLRNTRRGPKQAAARVTVKPLPGLQHVQQLANQEHVDVALVRHAAQAIRHNRPADEVAALHNVPPDTLRDILATLGSRLGNTLRSAAPKAAEVMAPCRGARLGLKPGLHNTQEQGTVVVYAEGWSTRKRDLRRAYALVKMCTSRQVNEAVQYVTQPTDATQPDLWQRAILDLHMCSAEQWFTLEDIVSTEEHARRIVTVWAQVVQQIQRSFNQYLQLVSAVHRDRGSKHYAQALLVCTGADVAKVNVNLWRNKAQLAVPMRRTSDRSWHTDIRAWTESRQALLWAFMNGAEPATAAPRGR